MWLALQEWDVVGSGITPSYACLAWRAWWSWGFPLRWLIGGASSLGVLWAVWDLLDSQLPCRIGGRVEPDIGFGSDRSGELSDRGGDPHEQTDSHTSSARSRSTLRVRDAGPPWRVALRW